MSKNKKRYKQTKKDLHSFDDSDISYQSAPEYLKTLKIKWTFSYNDTTSTKCK